MKSITKRCVVFLGATISLVIALSTFAQANDDISEPGDTAKSSTASGSSAAGSKKGSKRTTINFEDQLIEGRTQKPELFVLLQNRMNNSRRLFKLRENFLPEMRKTAEDVGRAGSSK